MNTPLLIQNAATSVIVYLELQAGGAAEGLTFSDVTAGLKKNGGAFAGFTLDVTNFTEIGDGFYEVDLESGDTDTLGSLYLSFIGADFKTALLSCYVTTPVTAPPIPAPGFTPSVTDIFGYVYTTAGVPMSGVRVVARVTQQPTIVHPTTDGILIGSGFEVTTTDSVGFFTLSLLTGATVEFIITDANYRRTIEIPGSSANLFDIP